MKRHHPNSEEAIEDSTEIAAPTYFLVIELERTGSSAASEQRYLYIENRNYGVDK